MQIKLIAWMHTLKKLPSRVWNETWSLILGSLVD